MSDEIARNIKYYRKKAKMSQDLLARLAGVSLMSIRRYETEGDDNREPNFLTLSKIADALNVSIIELANEETRDYPPFLLEKLREASQTRIKDFYSNDMTIDKQELLYNYELLNDNGKEEALKRVSELTEIPKYKKED